MPFFVLFVALILNGCAASYVRYDVQGNDRCPPHVKADTAMGVSVTVNDEYTCRPDVATELVLTDD
ncbi:hypothetical protein [Vibrio sp. 10N.261.46.A3]|uniref:hypothetical protein n=1 Tax=Vibrio sp. 10N.261.46.A3 TaxID=3229658 RepID=UPI003550024C